MTARGVDRRDLISSAIMTSMVVGLEGAWPSSAQAWQLDRSQTQIVPPGKIARTTPRGVPPRPYGNATLTGTPDQAGIYVVLVSWHPGYMRGPHTYATDRLCLVISATWWANSGSDFDPARCQPAPAGSFVRRVGGTPHYDGVIRAAREPAIIAICGIGPITATFKNPDASPLRRV